MSVTRRQFIVFSSVALGTGPLRTLLGAQAPAAAPAGKFEAIRRDIGYFTAQGGTIGWLINTDALVVIDTQYARTAPLCVDGLKQRSPRMIDVLFNTHHHADHTGGNAIFKPVTKKIVAQAKVPELQRQAAAAQPSPTPQVYADATFDTTWSEKMGDETVTARHYGPGHTGGDAVITFEKANVVHMGDLVFHQLHPRVDLPGGASIQGWIDRLATIAKAGSADTLYIVGHAKAEQPVVVRRDALARQASYFDAVLSYVRKAMADGKSKAEIAALQVLPGFESHAAMGQVLTLEAVLNAAYEELGAR